MWLTPLKVKEKLYADLQHSIKKNNIIIYTTLHQVQWLRNNKKKESQLYLKAVIFDGKNQVDVKYMIMDWVGEKFLGHRRPNWRKT